MFSIYFVLTHISQIEFRMVFFCLLTLFLSFVYAWYYSAIPFVDHLLIAIIWNIFLVIGSKEFYQNTRESEVKVTKVNTNPEVAEDTAIMVELTMKSTFFKIFLMTQFL